MILYITPLFERKSKVITIRYHAATYAPYCFDDYALPLSATTRMPRSAPISCSLSRPGVTVTAPFFHFAHAAQQMLAAMMTRLLFPSPPSFHHFIFFIGAATPRASIDAGGARLYLLVPIPMMAARQIPPGALCHARSRQEEFSS